MPLQGKDVRCVKYGIERTKNTYVSAARRLTSLRVQGHAIWYRMVSLSL